MMRIRWYGQSAFALHADASVFIDPFGSMSSTSLPDASFGGFDPYAPVIEPF